MSRLSRSVRGFEGQVWYNTLTPLKEQQNDPGSMVVCWEREQKHSWDSSRAYSRFLSPFDFVRFMLAVPEDDRCFYEVSGMGSAGMVKPFFDLDLYADTEDEAISRGTALLQELLDAVKLVAGEEYDEDLDAVLCQSAGACDPGWKFSVHLVVNGIAVTMPVAKQFAQECHSLLIGVPDREAIDMGVYTAGRLWRTVYSHKRGSTRTKRPVTGMRLNTRITPCGVLPSEMKQITVSRDPINPRPRTPDRQAQILSLTIYTGNLERSQISARSIAWSVDSVKYRPWVSRWVRTEVPRVEYSAMAAEALEKTEEALKSIEGGWVCAMAPDETLIKCTRTQPGHCPICARVHRSDNAFVVMSKRGLAFHCHRDTEKRSLLLSQ